MYLGKPSLKRALRTIRSVKFYSEAGVPFVTLFCFAFLRVPCITHLQNTIAFLYLCLILNEFEFVLFCFLDLVMINRNQDQVWTGEILSPLCDTWGQRQQKLEPIILIYLLLWEPKKCQ